MANPMQDSVTGKSTVPHHLVPTQKDTVGAKVQPKPEDKTIAPPIGKLKNKSTMTISPVKPFTAVTDETMPPPLPNLRQS